MLGNMLNVMNVANSQANDQPSSRRRHTRRYADHCVCMIDGKNYPVLNWSIGGVQVTADDRMFAEGQHADVVLKFKIRSTVIEVPHKANVVRKANGKIALQFEPLTRKVRNKFQNIIDDFMASEFANSQML